MSNELPARRSVDQVQGAYILAIIYTLGFLCMIASLMFFEIPASNREVLLTLVGIMSSAQLGIIKHYYDGSKAAETAQVANIARAAKSEAVIQDIAKSVPAAAAVAASAEPVKTDNMQVAADRVEVNQTKGTS